eukprot:TRINITY_DN1487_c0_g1_i1.p1 TRINITY_DN1487_c0_g1~~TRINITY_DN1487_c0_g1_i1.p1  ORF type:complete len:432 (-),score=93.31 TRINITY_DN1487_c0_g1_i1:94-1389(-)
MRIDNTLVRISYARKNSGGSSDPQQHQLQHQHQHQAGEQAQWAAASQMPNLYQGGAIPEGFIHDPNSGYYYNPTTGYYYDPTNGYYYNSKTGVYYYYDTTLQNFVPVTPATAAPVTTDPTAAANDSASTVQGAKKLEKEKKDVVVKKPKKKTKRDKLISQEMAKWNKKNKELKRQLAVEEAETKKVGNNKIKFSFKAKKKTTVFAALAVNKATPVPKDEKEQTTTQQKEVVPEQNGTAPNSDAIIQVLEAPPQLRANVSTFPPFITEELLQTVCILCRRRFPHTEALQNHRKISERHQRNLEFAKRQLLEKRRTTKRPNRWQTSSARKKRKVNHPGGAIVAPAQKPQRPSQLGESNIGNRLMKKMGWTEGSGLGANSSGITAPVEVTMRAERAGLGSTTDEARYAVSASDTYQQATKKKARARFDRLMGGR